MKFRNVSKVFDNIVASDAYTGRALWRCQQGSFETANPEGTAAKRRVLSMAPGLALPARRVLTLLDEVWIVGDGSVDGWANQTVRQSFWLKKATDLFTYQTPGQAALNSGGTAAYANREYLKDTVDNISTANYAPQYEVYVSKTETPIQGGFLRSATDLFRIRAVRDALAGFTMLSADSITLDAELTATFTTSTYNPSTDSKTVVSIAVPALLFSRVHEYLIQTEADPKYMGGDRTLVINKSSTTPSIGQEVVADGLNWKVEQFTSHYDAWSIHLRRR